MSLAALPLPELFALLVAMIASGAATGFLAGMFGVGGGAIIVPVLYELFRVWGVPEGARMALCVGTSLAIVVPTSIRSFRAHEKAGAVDRSVLKIWAPWLVLGVAGGAALARHAPGEFFKALFVCFCLWNAVRLFRGKKAETKQRPLVPSLAMKAYGVFVGAVSSLMGIGGGQLSTIFLTAHGFTIHRAIATSSGVGVLISIPGVIGFMISGWNAPGLPPLSLGFVSLVGAGLFIPASIMTAPIGARVAHRLAKRTLEKAFGTFMAVVAVRFIFGLAGY